ncbi:hypothetical protein [Bacillus thuringiensis]|uniref:Uncharacterized protein n=1 Tax=Bacillus thuringiensis YBT-1518 TaxID=529122 RepID=A0A9W3PJU8_BACTU|nr:hypothetical protein [Bacillus thuringiensis]AHA75769.1 hypothetical protein YBT1518_31435 [Bacillus thuringiensis YBT-1518]
MYFTFQKIEDDFIFTDICPELLNLIFQKRDDLVEKSVDTALHIKDKMIREKLKQLYTLAWNQKSFILLFSK